MNLFPIFLCISLFSYPGVNGRLADIQTYLENGSKYLKTGQFHSALAEFHEALNLDSENYLTYFKRGIVFLALGKYIHALEDFERTIELRPDFESGHFQRASLLMNQGRLEDANVYFGHVFWRNPGIEVATKLASIQKAWRLKEELTRYTSPNVCNMQVHILTNLISISPWDPSLRRRRLDCYLTLGKSSNAIADLRFTTRLTIDDTDGYHHISTLHYQLGELNEAVKAVRECLRLEPEHKLCTETYKRVKKLNKFYQDAMLAGENEQFSDCISSLNEALNANSELPSRIEFNLRHKLCWCLIRTGEGPLAVDQCSQAIKISEEPDVLCDRAEGYLLDDFFEDAIDDYKLSLQLGESNNRASAGLVRARRLRELSKKRDYYKILGVSRNVKKQEILKAYRHLARKRHPDKFRQGHKQKVAQAKFILIAAAKEVLTDCLKRAQFDRGFDPLT